MAADASHEKQQLHQLIDQLPPEQSGAFLRAPNSLATDPVLLSLLNAPPDDEPYTDAQLAKTHRQRSPLGAEKASILMIFYANLESYVKYTVILERESDGGFVASVRVLPGCISQGDTREEAMANIKEAIEVYVENCLAAGDPVPGEIYFNRR